MQHTCRGMCRRAAVTAAAVDHILLSYVYLDEGNLDGYASLLDEDVRMARQDLPPVRGRSEVVAHMALIAHPFGKHRLSRVIADGNCIAAEGRLTAIAAPGVDMPFQDVDFVDICTVSTTGLLLSQRRYYDSPLD